MERRRHYRVTAEFRRQVAVDVKDSRGVWWTANLVDISIGGAALVLDSESRNTMQRGQDVVLRFRSDRLSSEVEVPSKIYYVRSTKGPHRIGIGFDEWEDARSKLGPRLRSLFNQRQAFRVDVDLADGVEVQIQVGEELTVIEAQAQDFSILGTGLTVNHRHKEEIVMQQKIGLLFKLPSTDDLIELGAIIRHLDQAGPQISVGAEFVSDARFTVEARKHLRDYVMRRQLEMRRKGVRRD
jgi:c-di-GMP-binding flagellar brake protein YcgR